MRSLGTGDACPAKRRAVARQRPGKAALGAARCECYVRAVEFGILGPLAVWEDGRELELGAAKQRALLAICSCTPNELVPTPRLVDELWGERPPATAVKARAGVRLAAAQGARRGRARDAAAGLRRSARAGALDLQRFERLLDRGPRAARRRRRRRRRAACCARRSRSGAARRSRTSATRRSRANEIGRLEELRLVALELRLEADLALGRHAEAVAELEALVREHPLRESLRRLLMLALYRCRPAGRRARRLPGRARALRRRARPRPEPGAAAAREGDPASRTRRSTWPHPSAGARPAAERRPRAHRTPRRPRAHSARS